MLVNLHDCYHALVQQGDDPEVHREELSYAITQLLSVELSLRERELVAEILIALMRDATRELKIQLAHQLADFDNAPERLVLHLAYEEIDIAGAMLERSPVLEDMDLIYIINSHSAEYWRRIAKRYKMGGRVIQALAETRDVETVKTLIDNTAIKLPDQTTRLMQRMARDHTQLADGLVLREDAGRDLVHDLYDYLSEVIREKVIQRFPDLNEQDLDMAMEQAVDTVKSISDRDNIQGDTKAEVPQDRVADMLEKLRQGKIASFMIAFAQATSLNTAFIEQALREKSGSKLALICRAHDYSRDHYLQIYLLTNRIRNNDKVIRQVDLKDGLSVFDTHTPAGARAFLDLIA